MTSGWRQNIHYAYILFIPVFPRFSIPTGLRNWERQIASMGKVIENWISNETENYFKNVHCVLFVHVVQRNGNFRSRNMFQLRFIGELLCVSSQLAALKEMRAHNFSLYLFLTNIIFGFIRSALKVNKQKEDKRETWEEVKKARTQRRICV